MAIGAVLAAVGCGDDLGPQRVARIEWTVVGPAIVDFEVGSDGRPTLCAVEPGTVAIQASDPPPRC